MDKIYQFAYTDCVYESSFAAISLHRTKKGAETAMYLHKEERRKVWLECYPTKKEQKRMPFGALESWGVYKREILE